MTRDDLSRLEKELRETHGEEAWDAAAKDAEELIGPLVSDPVADYLASRPDRDKLASEKAKLTFAEYFDILCRHGSSKAWLKSPDEFIWSKSMRCFGRKAQGTAQLTRLPAPVETIDW